MKTYEELCELRAKTISDFKALALALEAADVSVGEFYSAMRWQENSCTDTQYNELFTGLIPEIEENNFVSEFRDIKEELAHILEELEDEK